MSNWNDNSDYKIDTWDPNSVKSPSNGGGSQSSSSVPQHPSFNNQTPTATRYESSSMSDYMNDYKRHIDMPNSAQVGYSNMNRANAPAPQSTFLQQQSHRPQQQQLPQPTFFQKQQMQQRQSPHLELLQQKPSQQRQSPHLELLQQKSSQQHQSPHLGLLQQNPSQQHQSPLGLMQQKPSQQHQSPHLGLMQQNPSQQHQSPHLGLMQQKPSQQHQSPLELLQQNPSQQHQSPLGLLQQKPSQQHQSPHLGLLQQNPSQQHQSPLGLLQQKQPQQLPLRSPYPNISNQSSTHQLSQSCTTFQSTNNNMPYTSYMGHTPEPKLASSSNNLTSGSQNYTPAVLSAPKCNRFYEQEDVDPQKIFTNPLIDGPDDFQTSKEEEIKIRNMKAANEKDQEFADRRPTSIAKASLAQISLDLQKAGEPFQSSTALKNFKNMSLGLLPTGDNQVLCKQDGGLSSPLSELCITKTSKLSVDAKEFIPGARPVTSYRKPAEKVMKETLDNLNMRPYLFDDEVPKLKRILKTYHLNAETVKPLASLLFEACLSEQNLLHHGSKICDIFSRTEGGFEGFRTGILSLAQKEFSNLDELLAGSDGQVGQERVKNFTKFMSELYLNMKDESSQRFNFLGDKVVDAVEKLLAVPNDSNIKCVIQVLKLTVKPLQQQFNLQSEEYKGKLDTIIKKVYSFKEGGSSSVVNLLNSLSNFMEKKPETPKVPTASHDHSLSEVVYFTPAGKAYTEQDVLDEEMMGICSSITEDYKAQLEIEHQQQNCVNNYGEQDDYDDDLDKWLKSL